jgi:hypothetical protein
MRKSRKYSASEHAIIAGMIAICCIQPGMAGTQGSYMNSKGEGVASDSVAFGSAVVKATSPYTQDPCARVDGGEAPTFVCGTESRLPTSFPGKAYCQSKGQASYKWSIQANAVGGATCDNHELEDLLNIIPANCAELEVTTSAVFTDAFSGIIKVEAIATDGAGIRVRGFESLTQPDNLDELKANGQLRFDYSLAGPFNLDDADCTALTIPFKTQSGHENLYFVVDTVALSVPLVISCPGDVVAQCGEPLVYPDVHVLSGGCGDPSTFTVSYDPPESALPNGVPTLVTATVTDGGGNTQTCTFTATRSTLAFDGFYAPINSPGVVYLDGDPCRPAALTVNRGSVVPIKFRTTCGGSDFDSGNPPTFRVVKCATGEVISVGSIKFVANAWQGVWDTSELVKGAYKGDYQVIVTLQDGSQRAVTINLK